MCTMDKYILYSFLCGKILKANVSWGKDDNIPECSTNKFMQFIKKKEDGLAK